MQFWQHILIWFLKCFMIYQTLKIMSDSKATEKDKRNGEIEHWDEFISSFLGWDSIWLKDHQSLMCLPEIFLWTCFWNQHQVIWGAAGSSRLPYPGIECSIKCFPRGKAGKGNRIPLSIYYLSHVKTWSGLPWWLRCQHIPGLMQPLSLGGEAGVPRPGLPTGSF